MPAAAWTPMLMLDKWKEPSSWDWASTPQRKWSLTPTLAKSCQMGHGWVKHGTWGEVLLISWPGSMSGWANVNILLRIRWTLVLYHRSGVVKCIEYLNMKTTQVWYGYCMSIYKATGYIRLPQIFKVKGLVLSYLPIYLYGRLTSPLKGGFKLLCYIRPP